MLVDKLGKEVKVGDRVVYASYKNLGMTFGTVTKLGRIRAEITPEAPAFNPAAESFNTNDIVKV